jgi:hypothetical protein
LASSAVTSEVSLVLVSSLRAWMSSSLSSTGISAISFCSSPVLVRFPLWPSAMDPSAVGRKVGWALFQVLAPVVE